MNFYRSITDKPLFASSKDAVPLAVLIVVVAAITLILYPNLVITPHVYQPGDVVQRDIKAKKDFLVKDDNETEVRRQAAALAVHTVYDYDDTMTRRIVGKVQKAFQIVRSVYDTATPPTEAPETSTAADTHPETATTAPATASVETMVRQKKGEFESALGIDITSGAYRTLEKERFSPEIEAFISRILTEILENGVVTNKEYMLQESEHGVILRNITTKNETTEYSLRPIFGLDQAKTMVRIVGQPLLKDQNSALRNLIVDVSQRLIQPNITINRSETKERRTAAAAAIKPILYQIKAGEMLLREGERVTEADLAKLKMARASADEHSLPGSGLGAAAIITFLLLGMYIPNSQPRSRLRWRLNRNVIFLATILIVFLLLARLVAMFTGTIATNPQYPVTVTSLYWGIPLGSGAMIVCLFLGLEIAIPFSVVLAVGTAAIFQNNFGILLYFLVSDIMAAYWLQNCRERKVFIKAGLKVAMLNVVLVTAVDAYLSQMGDMKLFWDWSFAFLGGIMAGIITAGLAPLVEIAFDYTTDIKLMELANLDRPILRRLMIEAPGTYHHSMVVGSLVEAAASEIEANPLLAKVCGYYHDIGKINKPLYFIENQTDGKNKHDKLAPSMSKRILIAHVKDGVDFARQHKLGQIITDVIRQSHGTSVISFFYNKALKSQGEEAVNMADYRYPGPKPQTREAGLVMLADVVEAASRTLDNPTPARIQGLVQKLINKIFSDGELDECELTLKDLHNIAKSFIKILTGIHHHRIEYPEKTPQKNGKSANGHSDRQPPATLPDRHEDSDENGSSHLKRLGMS